MARLKFGSFEVTAELPKLDQLSPKIGPAVVEQEKPSEPDFSVIFKEIEVLKTDLFEKAQQKDPDVERLQLLVNDHVFMLINHEARLDDLESRPALDLPEVKNITHVKDVSPEVIKFCERMGLRIENKYDVIVAGLDKQRRDQKSLNIILGFGLVLTILLHLL